DGVPPPTSRPPRAAAPAAADPAGDERRGAVRVGARHRAAEAGRLARTAGGAPPAAVRHLPLPGRSVAWTGAALSAPRPRDGCSLGADEGRGPSHRFARNSTRPTVPR